MIFLSRAHLDLLRARYGLGATNLLGKGMEADAYAYGETQVLKVYTNNPPWSSFVTCKPFMPTWMLPGWAISYPRFERVIRYGRGLMRLKFPDIFPLLRYPDMIGQMGVLGTQLLFDPKNKVIVILSLGSMGYMETSVRLLVEAVGVLQRVRP